MRSWISALAVALTLAALAFSPGKASAQGIIVGTSSYPTYYSSSSYSPYTSTYAPVYSGTTAYSPYTYRPGFTPYATTTYYRSGYLPYYSTAYTSWSPAYASGYYTTPRYGVGFRVGRVGFGMWY